MNHTDARAYWRMPASLQMWTKIIQGASKGEYRPTIVIIPEDSEGRIGIARQNTAERQWSFPQGKIEMECDVCPIDAAFRELGQEVGISPEMASDILPYLYDYQVPFMADSFRTGYTNGSSYIVVGIKFHQNVSVTLNHELLEWHWGAPDEIRSMLLQQPGAYIVTEAIRRKTLKILLPSLDSLLEFRSHLGVISPLFM